MSERAYRFSLTAPEIERLLLSINDSIQKLDIIYDYTAGGTEGQVAAASAVKNMWLKLNEMVTGEGLKDAINAANDSNVFTDYYKSILDRETWKFIGSPADLLARDDIDTSNFEGGEVILLQKNASGNPEFQYWKRTPVAGGDPIFGWESVYEGNSNDSSIDIPVVGTSILKTIPKALFHMVEFRVHARESTLGHWQDTDGKIGYRGEDLIYSLYNHVQTKPIANISFSQDVDNMIITITTLEPNIKCHLSFIAGY
ncbi:hypothetical protein PKNFJJPA_00031 [Salmonella phage vB_SenAc_BPS6]|uniref:Uncharacterized protein n=29 Tax=Caudoviricetes TaxID=2731619 RepID=A0A1W5PUW3_9CAUD|nr:hypothetical protein SFP_0099 [Salmonella phage SFP10]YP_004957799.1 hypothetical protein CBA120_gp096 [Escherichia phage Cba120]YP_007002742.1 hypothetical protein F371_gp109 [Escherichia phage PhaxI]YP_009030519.1 hypothetical protein FF15_gp135 [Salmonella phage vB-SalM-SJ3]YP_009220889.1 hypothetical protein SP38_145 [Salmonella phage 38]YP_009283914.1 hypothetical protein BI169_gp071 [Salmonella phage GG32]YP_009875930.1 hypothetical protein HYP05_gp021 [Salmonella phage ST-W77]YP_00